LFGLHVLNYDAQFKTFIFAAVITINYPEPSFRIKKEDGQTFLFDPLRKRWLVLTNEEWVRQNFVNYLINVQRYPSALIALEKEIYLGELKKRFDILVYNRDHQPWLLAECKSPEIKMDEPVLEQTLRYGISIPANFLVITNGGTTYCWTRTEKGLGMMNSLPSWPGIE